MKTKKNKCKQKEKKVNGIFQGISTISGSNQEDSDGNLDRYIQTLESQIMQCQTECTSYNNSYLTSSTITTIFIAVAGLVKTEKGESFLAEYVFYLLPTIYNISLYNLLKYTGTQLRIGVYRWTLEHKLNQALDRIVLNRGQKVEGGVNFYVIDGASQALFYIPVAAIIFYLFYIRCEHTFEWKLMLVFIVVQVLLILYMAFGLTRIESETLKKLGYSKDKTTGEMRELES